MGIRGGGADWIKFPGSGGLGDPYGGPDETAYTREEIIDIIGQDHGRSRSTFTFCDKLAAGLQPSKG